MPLQVVLTTCLVAAAATAETIDFVNKCTFPIELYHSQGGSTAAKMADIAIGASFSTHVSGSAHMFRHTADPSSTLVELACDILVWYDLSVIPPMSALCESYEKCKAGGKTGFNIPIAITPKANIGKDTCVALTCAADDKIACQDAYHFPMDNIKTHSCPVNTGLEVTFCFNNGGSDDHSADQYTQLVPTGMINQADTPNQDDVTPDQTDNGLSLVGSRLNPTGLLNDTGVLPTGSFKASHDDSDDVKQESPDDKQGTVQSFSDLGEIKATYSYKGKYAGNVPGSYDRVTDLAQCSKESVSVQSPVGPMAEPVSMIFRGPMEIRNIAVFSAKGANGTWSRVSSYSRDDGTAENMVFLNNMNADFSGQGGHGPQGYASEDGKSLADKPTVFGGVLAEASGPSNAGGGGMGISSGVEINIMTEKKCDGECLGYYSKNDHLGWGGGKKAFVTEVKMPKGAMPDQPAIWMLNAQVMQSNQYACNCRGMGPVGGCGELDIAEVIETNPSRDKVTTHYYFFDGSVLSKDGDNFACRPYDEFTVYLTLIDDSGDGLIKIVQLSSFDFKMTELDSLYQQLVDC